MIEHIFIRNLDLLVFIVNDWFRYHVVVLKISRLATPRVMHFSASHINLQGRGGSLKMFS